MEPERWSRVETLFHRAADLDSGDRAALLDAECGADAELRAAVEQLLCDDTADDDLFGRLEQRTCSAQDDPMLGRSIDSYRLVSRLAVGGMGVVYRAERTDGLFEHEVAVKLIRAERATEGLVRRFELERRALAALHHPCIARLYDGGSTDDGRPYLVMELVHGLPIDRFCERERLPVAERLRLFVQVCRAVHYAHQNLVVHRDLKPSNILIDEQGLPRLLDFGIARLLEHDEGMEPPAATLTVARILTPEYASPEQLAGGRVTTALDIYSLGVILYELLTGHRPFEFESRSPADWERIVGEHAPARPSTVVRRPVAGTESLAERCGSTPAGLSRRLRGDLDRIVLMALRKEPERRYASAQEFADDIERHLSGRPVLARADSLWYRGSKFVRRNRLAVAAVTAVIGALLMGVVVSRRSEERAELEAEHARIEAESFQEIADFLMDAFLPTAAAQDATWQRQARDRILQHVERVRRQHPKEDHIRANLLESLGQVCQRISLYEDAEGLIREALAIRERAFGRRSLEVALSLQSLGQLDYRRGDYSRAADELREALELNRTCAPGTHTDVASVANDLAACLRAGGNEIEAERLHLEALALRRGDADGTLPVAESLNNLAGIHMDRGEFDQAAQQLEEALEIRTSILGAQHPLTLQTISNLANARWQLGQREEAHALVQQAADGYRALRADGAEGLGLLLSNLAAMQLAEGDPDAAERNLEEALELQSTRLGPDHPLVAVTLTRLANLDQSRGRTLEARELWQEVLAIRRSASSSLSALCETLYEYGVFLAKTQACAEAVPVLEESIAGLRSLKRSDSLTEGRAELALGSCLATTDRTVEALVHLHAAVRLLEESPRATTEELDNARARLQQVEDPSGD